MIYWLNNIKDTDKSEVGTNALTLSKIFKTALNVPIGFVIPSKTYFSFVHNLGIDSIMEGVDTENPDEIKFAARKIQLLIMEKNFSNDEIEDAYDTLSADNLSEKDSPLVSVKISPAVEDEALTALLQEFFTDVKGAEELIKHVKACYSSIFTAKNILYLKKNNYDWKNISLPIVVQQSVDAEFSGIAYTKNPSSDADEVVIEAVFGSLEGLEKNSPDVYIVDKDSNELKQSNIGEKTLMFTRDKETGKTINKTLSDDKMKLQVMEERFTDEVARISKRVEKVLDGKQKVSWVFDGKQFFVVGSEPMK